MSSQLGCKPLEGENSVFCVETLLSEIPSVVLTLENVSEMKWGSTENHLRDSLFWARTQRPVIACTSKTLSIHLFEVPTWA